MECRYCGQEIGVGSYLRYKGMPFCEGDCLGDYLVDQADEEGDIEWNCFNSTPENDYIDAMEEKEAVRRDIAHEW